MTIHRNTVFCNSMLLNRPYTIAEIDDSDKSLIIFYAFEYIRHHTKHMHTRKGIVSTFFTYILVKKAIYTSNTSDVNHCIENGLMTPKDSKEEEQFLYHIKYKDSDIDKMEYPFIADMEEGDWNYELSVEEYLNLYELANNSFKQYLQFIQHEK